jgi:hypothetical protein
MSVRPCAQMVANVRQSDGTAAGPVMDTTLNTGGANIPTNFVVMGTTVLFPARVASLWSMSAQVSGEGFHRRHQRSLKGLRPTPTGAGRGPLHAPRPNPELGWNPRTLSRWEAGFVGSSYFATFSKNPFDLSVGSVYDLLVTCS